jgi:hypothetical protein
MHDRVTQELRELRARAYGPDADIAADAVALSRLQELEDATIRQEFATADPQTADAETDAAPGDADPEGAEPRGPGHRSHRDAADHTVDAARELDADPETGAPDRWSRRRIVGLWIASLAVAVVAASALSWAITRSADADPRQVAVLELGNTDDAPGFLRQTQGAQTFSEFFGLLAASTGGSGWMGPATDSCLYVMRASQVVPDSDSFAGEVYMGCGAGGFPASVQLRVTDRMPSELQGQFPIGTALQFVLGESEVVVLSDAP